MPPIVLILTAGHGGHYVSVGGFEDGGVIFVEAAVDFAAAHMIIFGIDGDISRDSPPVEDYFTDALPAAIDCADASPHHAPARCRRYRHALLRKSRKDAGGYDADD